MLRPIRAVVHTGSLYLTALLPLVIALLASPVVALAGLLRPRFAGWAALAMSALSFGAVVWSWSAGGGTLDIPWAPSWNLRLTFSLDGLAAMYGLLATGVGFVVVWYSTCYITWHLEHEHRPAAESIRFYALILLFMGAMVGLVMAQDLLLLFVFFDLTAITSYFLIGYDREKREARDSALMAMLVTGIASILFLIGALMLYVTYGTFALADLAGQVEPGVPLTIAGLLIAVAALAKSAQVPLHFWLPRAMAAPTPVSAYLHSAAMVAAGVFLLQRLYPLLQHSADLLTIVLAVGLLSMAVGGILALTHDALKEVLAYSTIAQYGYIVTMLGLGGEAGVAGASFYVIAHGIAKSALFLTAGAVTMATGEDRLSRIGGVWRSLPLLAAGSGAAAAALAALPLTIGFFKDELFFEAAAEHGWAFGAAAVLSAGLTFAYTWRFWSGIFLGAPSHAKIAAPFTLVGPVVVLGVLAVAGGVVVAPFAHLAEAAATASLGRPVPVDVAYHLDARPANLMALAAYAVGILTIVTRPGWVHAANWLAAVGRSIGPEHWYHQVLRWLDVMSRRLGATEARDLRNRIAAVVVPSGMLVGVALAVTPAEGTYRVGEVTSRDFWIILFLLLTIVSAVAVIIPRNRLTLILASSSVSFSLALVYAAFGAPNVALVTILVTTVSTPLFLGILSLFPLPYLRRSLQMPRPARDRELVVGTIASFTAFIFAWGVLSQPSRESSVALEHIRLAPEANASDVVTSILADFRGFDTLGEITVIAIALVGLMVLLRAERPS